MFIFIYGSGGTLPDQVPGLKSSRACVLPYSGAKCDVPELTQRAGGLGHCVTTEPIVCIKLVFVYLRAFFGAIIVYIRLMQGSYDARFGEFALWCKLCKGRIIIIIIIIIAI